MGGPVNQPLTEPETGQIQYAEVTKKSDTGSKVQWLTVGLVGGWLTHEAVVYKLSEIFSP